ncbi:uncharacterized protein THITE_2117448 [Thermothielavioides terrestris NRRL 8126]|uniref:Uncharacterized protein n=1 Tax=Thermothielavioides terrestris (strain ATCC 38088 / NRRL 8126) TaxID=578455 RepID=G2R828_THETT|nr:uncharacterized protein THITE_2117448 [Thermothielavioides terrestris NRRL 8126]AEO68087.1 hypothetical protein THITE_2117448 [Thermothielavioides terrestris NRRL 8126]
MDAPRQRYVVQGAGAKRGRMIDLAGLSGRPLDHAQIGSSSAPRSPWPKDGIGTVNSSRKSQKTAAPACCDKPHRSCSTLIQGVV